MATITSPRESSPASSTPRIKSPSIAETPSSSTRGSVDLPSRPTNTGPSAVPRRANRAALRDYYNLKAKQPSQQAGLSRTASITSTTSDTSTAISTATLTENNSTTSALTAQLDREDFDAHSYIPDLLAKSSLQDILRVEATLVSEIRNLDGERKALVYDNYSKLIKAVSTIGEMHRTMNQAGSGLSEVGALEEKMARLRVMTKEVADSEVDGEEVRKDEAERRKMRKEAKEVQRKKEVVQWVLDAPIRLTKMIKDDQGEEARQEWQLVLTYLEKWDGVKGAAEVRKQCEEVMQSVT